MLDSRGGAPLAGHRVIALEQAVAAPLCSRHLADLGAEVIKVERPDGGDFARRYDSIVHGESAYFVWLNRGKRSVVADLSTDMGKALLDALLGTADVFIHNLGPGAVERLGYGWDRLQDLWPQLISCAISGYGQTGPYRDDKAFDLLVQGESGLASVTGSPREPAKVGISIADIAAGMYALSSVLGALIQRQRTGIGISLDISMLDSLAEWMSVPALYQRYAGAPPPRTGLHHATIAPYGPYTARDGPTVLLAVQNETQWRRFGEVVLQRPDLASDPRFATNELRVRNRVSMDEEIRRSLAGIEYSTLIDRLRLADLPHAPVNDVEALLDHPQLVERQRWIESDTPTGPVISVSSPFGEPAKRTSVPALGEDTAALEFELGVKV